MVVELEGTAAVPGLGPAMDGPAGVAWAAEMLSEMRRTIAKVTALMTGGNEPAIKVGRL